MGYAKGLLITALVTMLVAFTLLWSSRSRIEKQHAALMRDFWRLETEVKNLSGRLPAKEVFTVSIDKKYNGRMVICLLRSRGASLSAVWFEHMHVTTDSCAMEFVKDKARLWCPLVAQEEVERCAAAVQQG